MRKNLIATVGMIGLCVMTTAVFAQRQEANTTLKTPADGHTIHVVAPHVVNGKVMGPFHHYCKVLAPDPVIECLIYESTDPDARLEEIEYIIAKS